MANTMTGTVVGYFSTQAQAETAVSALKSAGFQSNQIGIALANESGAGYQGSSASTTGSATGSTAGSTQGTSGIAAKTENAWERFKSFFDSSDVEPYADENARGSVESHEITGAHAYDHDDFSQSLSGMNVPQDRSKYFSHRIGSGAQGAVVTVSATGREQEAEAILEQNGGDIGADTTGYDYNTPPAAAASTEPKHIQLLGEVLRVQKERISRGEVRIRKEVVTEQQTIQVPVTREELVIERIPVSGTTPVAGQIGAESEIRIPLSEERAYADKQTVVREEIAVGKRSIEGIQQVGDSVRHEELEVEDSTTARQK